eukprot:CAMPEP_0196589646 /NCGR_PEP_ID=MMETSP1081-20130531/64163_1 /TAXON_ID=36882 /ORGANISM="Pyramimonas amylifera, Strain CCMP720" /LENGTH=666 /DNA_ID=CAMNT_0041912501 /DNA_START=61 /DNA_END=2061 /DNA_ORIENTATION=+
MRAISASLIKTENFVKKFPSAFTPGWGFPNPRTVVSLCISRDLNNFYLEKEKSKYRRKDLSSFDGFYLSVPSSIRCYVNANNSDASTVQYLSDAFQSEDITNKPTVSTTEMKYSWSFDQQMFHLYEQNKSVEVVNLFRKRRDDATEGESTFNPNFTTCKIFLNEAARMKQVSLDELLETIEGMRARGLEPDIMSYNTLFRFCVRNSDAAGAEAVWQQLAVNQVAPDSDSYMNVVLALTDGGQAGKALTMLKMMHKEGLIKSKESKSPDDVDAKFLFQSLVNVLVRTKDLDTLLVGLEFGREIDMVPSPWILGETLMVANKLSHVPLAVMLVRIFKEMLNNPPMHRGKVATFNYISEGEVLTLLNLAHRTKTLKLAEAAWALLPVPAPSSAPAPSLYHAFIECRAASGDLEGAFQLMASLFENHPNADQSWVAFTPLVHGFSLSTAHLDKAYHTLVDMRAANQSVPAAAVNLILAACVNMGNINRAFETFVELESVFGLTPTVELYTTLMQACWKNSKPEVVHELYDEMKERGLLPSNETNAQKMEAFIIQKDFDEAKKMLYHMRKNRQQLPKKTANRLIAALRRGKQWRALKHFGQLMKGWWGFEEIRSQRVFLEMGRMIIECHDDIRSQPKETKTPINVQDTVVEAASFAESSNRTQETAQVNVV